VFLDEADEMIELFPAHFIETPKKAFDFWLGCSELRLEDIFAWCYLR
jgi:hypothetical protein